MATENLDAFDEYAIQRTGKKVPEVYKSLTRKVIGDIPERHFRTVPLIIQHVIDEKQAQLADACPGTPGELAAKLARSVESVQADLDMMYQRGVVVPSSRTGVYNIWPNTMLFVDRLAPHTYKLFPVLGPDYVNLWNQWDLDLDERRKNMVPKFGGIGVRVIPAIKAVKDHPDLQPWEDLRALVRMRRTLALVPCHCRLSHIMDHTCASWTPELCLVMDRSAEYNIDSGAGRQITADEAIDFLQKCEDAGLYHQAGDTRFVDGLICTCCSDCCLHSRAMRIAGGNKNPVRVTPSRYTATINRGRCDGCAKQEQAQCAKWCPFGANVVMKLDKIGAFADKPKLTDGECMGCGICVAKCPQVAISMRCNKDEDWVPDVGRWLRPGQKDTDELWSKKV